MSAQKADQIVYSKLETWAKIIDVLALPEDELENSVPGAGGSDDANHELVDRLRELVNEMDDQLIKRRQIGDRAKKTSNGDDISPALLRKAAQLTSKSPVVKIDPAQFEELFVDELRKYDVYLMEIDRQDERQGQILREMSQLHHAFTNQNSSSAAAKRERALQNLSQAYHKFTEIKTNLQEGLKVI